MGDISTAEDAFSITSAIKKDSKYFFSNNFRRRITMIIRINKYLMVLIIFKEQKLTKKIDWYSKFCYLISWICWNVLELLSTIILHFLSDDIIKMEGYDVEKGLEA